MLARGRQLALEDDAAHNLPACRACHGDLLTGVLQPTPGFLGLPRDDIAGQLGAWLKGQRHADAPDCMGQLGRRLGPCDAAAQPRPFGMPPCAHVLGDAQIGEVASFLRQARGASSTPLNAVDVARWRGGSDD
jgi:cytochrome c553